MTDLIQADQQAQRTAPIVVTFTTTFAEQVAIARSIHRATRSWVSAMFLFAGLPFFLALRTAWVEGMNAQVLVLGLVAAVGLVFWNVGIAWISVRAARRGVRNPDGPFTWVIDETACRMEGPSTAVSLQWTAIVDTKETPDSFLLYVSHNVAHFLPKRAVPEAGLSRLRGLLERGKGRLGTQPAANPGPP